MAMFVFNLQIKNKMNDPYNKVKGVKHLSKMMEEIDLVKASGAAHGWSKLTCIKVVGYN